MRARIIAIACCEEDADDLGALRDGPGFRVALNKLPGSLAGLASQPTIGRGASAPITRALPKLLAAMIDIYRDSHRPLPQAVALDIDHICGVVHGDQQLSLSYGQNGECCLLPVHVRGTASGRPVTTPRA